MKVVTAADVRSQAGAIDRRRRRRTDYLGRRSAPGVGPQAFLIERPDPGSRVDRHCHDVDQFQVVLEGSCRLGDRRATPVTVSYTDAFTPYGPVVGGPRGFASMTVRPVVTRAFYRDRGEGEVPCREDGRAFVARFAIERPGPGPCAWDREKLFGPSPDRVAAWGLRLGPDASARGPAAVAGGEILIVCGGEVGVGRLRLPARSLLHLEGGEPPPDLRGGAAGADLVVLRFGRRSA